MIKKLIRRISARDLYSNFLKFAKFQFSQTQQNTPQTTPISVTELNKIDFQNLKESELTFLKQKINLLQQNQNIQNPKKLYFQQSPNQKNIDLKHQFSSFNPFLLALSAGALAYTIYQYQKLAEDNSLIDPLTNKKTYLSISQQQEQTISRLLFIFLNNPCELQSKLPLQSQQQITDLKLNLETNIQKFPEILSTNLTNEVKVIRSSRRVFKLLSSGDIMVSQNLLEDSSQGIVDLDDLLTLELAALSSLKRMTGISLINRYLIRTADGAFNDIEGRKKLVSEIEKNLGLNLKLWNSVVLSKIEKEEAALIKQKIKEELSELSYEKLKGYVKKIRQLESGLKEKDVLQNGCQNIELSLRYENLNL